VPHTVRGGAPRPGCRIPSAVAHRARGAAYRPRWRTSPGVAHAEGWWRTCCAGCGG